MIINQNEKFPVTMKDQDDTIFVTDYLIDA
jgi:hypothetical protein